MKRGTATIAMLGLWVAVAAAPAPAGPEPAVVEEILTILRQRGIVDQGEYERLAARYAESERKRDWLDRLHFSGDFRARHEGFWFDEDDTAAGDERSNRHRGRYRFRLAGRFDVNDWSAVHLRLASGEDDSRSTNQSFGSGVDFDPDRIFIDQAYAELEPPGHWMPEGTKSSLLVGKQGNPFLWKVGKDPMLWDGDVNPEGVGVKLDATPGEGLQVFLRGGYFVIDEESSHKDPHLVGAQLGGELALTEALALGARGTYYAFRSVDEEFLCRGSDGASCDGTVEGATSSGGNLLGGLSGSPSGSGFDVGEAGAYLKWIGSETFPLTLYGNWARNFDAESVGAAGEEDTAWGVGLEVGDKRKLAMLGVGYWEVEANAFPSQFIDSDLFDGFTNRKGWALYGSRQLFPDTDLNVTLFVSDEIEDREPEFEDSLSGAERLRLQTDLVFEF